MQFKEFLKSENPAQKRLKKNTLNIIYFWSLIIVLSLSWNRWNEANEVKTIAENIARASLFKDQAFRKWAAWHGGIYVPTTGQTPPNSHLAHIIDRDIQKPDGTKLTLMNPAYMLRQIMNKYSGLYGVKGKITSLKYLNESNKPDGWEIKALKSFEKGAEEAFEYTEIDSQPFLRLMRPMITTEKCLKCHAVQGYKVGDVRGGVGVNLPLQTLYNISKKHEYSIVFGHLCIWLLVFGGIGYFSLRESAHLEKQNTMHQSLQENEEQLRLMIEKSPLPMVITKKNQDIEYYNDKFIELFGYTLEDISTADKWWRTCYPNEEYRNQVIQSWTEAIEKAQATNSDIEMQEWEWTIKDGSIHLCEFFMVPLSGSSLIIMNDITEKKRSEIEIKASLKEKETLLHEIHHRVKNNMQVINSLLKLQSNNIEDEQIKEVFKESQGRVFAMAAVHETLHGSEKLSEIDLKSYLSKITTAIFQTYATKPAKVKLNSDVDDSPININQAYPLGLIVNELISNSLKYAFPDKRTGEITLSMKIRDKELELVVMDDGIGMPDGLDWKNSSTLGFKLVQTLVENQLDGSIDMGSNNGTKFIIKFNIEA